MLRLLWIVVVSSELTELPHPAARSSSQSRPMPSFAQAYRGVKPTVARGSLPDSGSGSLRSHNSDKPGEVPQ